jgi:nitrilase
VSDDLPTFIGAVVQASPVFFDRDTTIDKACHLIEQASGEGARLIVFPETWVPGYPSGTCAGRTPG